MGNIIPTLASGRSSRPVPPVEPDVRDVLSGLSGPAEVEKLKRIRDWAHNIRLIYEALLGEGFTEAQAVVILQPVAALDSDPSKSKPVTPIYPGPVVPFIHVSPDTSADNHITINTTRTNPIAQNSVGVNRVINSLSPPYA